MVLVGSRSVDCGSCGASASNAAESVDFVSSAMGVNGSGIRAGRRGEAWVFAAGKIAAISTSHSRREADDRCKGLGLPPGVIDLQEPRAGAEELTNPAHDGLTNIAELEAGTEDVTDWYAAREGKSFIN